MIQITNKHWWGDCYHIDKMAYNQCLVCQTHNPVKAIKTSGGVFSLSDFIQLSFSVGYQYIYMLPGWIEAFPSGKADLMMVTNKLFKKYFLYGASLEKSPATEEPISLDNLESS